MNTNLAAYSVHVNGLLKTTREMIPAITIKNRATNKAIMIHRSKLSKTYFNFFNLFTS